MKDIFVDRFLKFTTSQGVVRLDFGRVESIDNKKNEISVSPSMRLALPIEGFTHFVEQAIQHRDQLMVQEKPCTKSSEVKQEMELFSGEKKENDSVH